MTSLGDLLRGRTDLTEAEIEHLHRLVGEWQAIADLAFGDLLLFARDERSDPQSPQWICVAQMRPSTGTTLYDEDLVSGHLPLGEREPVDRAWSEQRIVRDTDPIWRDEVPIREEAVPVRSRPDARVIAVLARDIDVRAMRTPSALELAYVACAGDLAQMVAEGAFPFPESADTAAEAPRVGDGMLRLDLDGVVVFASPNAQSALRRLGFSANIVGADLLQLVRDLDLAVDVGSQRPDAALIQANQSGVPTETELTARRGDVAVRVRAIPLTQAGSLVGSLVLVRDVTEVRRRDRALTTKDATIREIHHRVKNNLQTVAALLRLQGRRMSLPEARAALDESVRRVTSIAVVHETLSQAIDENVPFDSIADTIAGMSIDLASTDGHRASVTRVGSFGKLPSEVATPLALVLSELVSNAVEHGYHGSGGPLRLLVDRDAERLEVIVADAGVGLPENFALETGGLGLQIVRTLVVGEMRGEFAVRPGEDGGTQAAVSIPATML